MNQHQRSKSVQQPEAEDYQKLGIDPWRQRKYATRTISNVKEVADDRVRTVRDLKTDSTMKLSMELDETINFLLSERV